MEWVQSINKAIEYIEKHLTEDIHCEDVSRYVHISSFHFQRMFHLFTDMTVGEYIKKRRLSLAGEELTKQNSKVIDVAFRYGYQSPESFAKAFTRFHGITLLWSSIFVTLVAKKYRFLIKLPFLLHAG